MAMRVRRVVTGHDGAGKAVFASDEEVDPLTVALLPGAEFYRLWGADQAPTFPDDGRSPPEPTYFPPVGGYRFGLFSMPPGSRTTPPDVDLEGAMREVEEKLPGLLGDMEPDNPGMHTTDTIDFQVVLSGEVVLELDNGAESVLRPGETVVQNGTRHRWSNRGSEPAVMAGVYRRRPTRRPVNQTGPTTAELRGTSPTAPVGSLHDHSLHRKRRDPRWMASILVPSILGRKQSVRVRFQAQATAVGSTGSSGRSSNSGSSGLDSSIRAT
jgi:mannose-6-phosphate isomerase-like protein (cupin superfamily)